MARKKARVVLVSGSREWGESQAVPILLRELEQFPSGSWVIHGGQRRRIPGTEEFTGVDWWAGEVAKRLRLLQIVVPFYQGIGPGGGPVRNRVMCKIARSLEAQGHEVTALFFHDNIEESRGTKDCRAAAEEMGLRYDVVEE